MNYDPKVDAYIEKAAPFAQPILRHIRELVHKVCPDVDEGWKWNFPFFIYKDTPLIHMSAFKAHCAVGFWKRSLMKDEDEIFKEGDTVLGGLGRLTSLADLPKDTILKKYLKEAMRLNEEGINIVRKKPSEKQKKELTTPDYFIKLLGTNKAAEKKFNSFPYSHRKEYIQWFEEAKSEVTREKRTAQALEWIAEGKGRNWKYENR